MKVKEVKEIKIKTKKNHTRRLLAEGVSRSNLQTEKREKYIE